MPLFFVLVPEALLDTPYDEMVADLNAWFDKFEDDPKYAYDDTTGDFGDGDVRIYPQVLVRGPRPGQLGGLYLNGGLVHPEYTPEAVRRLINDAFQAVCCEGWTRAGGAA